MTTTTIQTTAGSEIEAFINRVIGILDYGAFTYTDTAATLTNSAGERVVFRGNFGDFDEFNKFSATVTSIVLSVNGDLYATSTGFSSVFFTLAGQYSPLFGQSDGMFDILGSHTMIGNAGSDVFNGTEVTDVLRGAAGNDRLFGDGGDDLLEGGIGADVLNGATGNDTITYANSTVRVIANLATGKGSGGEATGDVYKSVENITGSDFNDTLNGNSSANRLFGGKGNDTLAGGGRNDHHDGGEGTDTVSLATSTAGVGVNLATGNGFLADASGDTYVNIENVTGSAYDDYIVADAKINVLIGNGGNDRLEGGLNNDTLKGGAGNDRLIGGQGVDKIYGDAGADTIVVDRLPGNRDTIYAFEAGTDKLEIKAADFLGGLAAGVALAPGQVVRNETGLAGDADDRFILNTATGQLFYDVNGSVNGNTGSVVVAVFASGIPTLTASDFLIA